MPRFVSKLTLPARPRQRIVAICAVVAVQPLLASAAHADDTRWHSNADIQATAESHVLGLTRDANNRTTVRAGSLDPRHRLPHCDRDLESFMRQGSAIGSRTVVGVQCRGSRPWKIFVPVEVVVLAEVFTAKHTLPRGHLITADDLAVAERDVSRMMNGYLTSTEALVGQRLKQSVIAGRVVTPAMLEADRIVKRGQTVTLIASQGGLKVSMTGKALSDGSLNQRIRVENVNSGRVVEGIVRSTEHVEIVLPGTDRIFTAKPKVSPDSADTEASNNDR